MKVAIVTQSGEADAVRGIGVYTSELTKELKNIRTGKLEIEIVQKKEIGLKKYDIFHYPDFRMYFSFPKISENNKTIVTIHDVIPLIYPKAYPPGLKGNFKLLLQKMLLKKIDAVITVSETSKKDIVRFLGIPQEIIKVIYEAPRSIFSRISKVEKLKAVRNKYNLPEKFVLYVGDVNYNKNILGLVEACKNAQISLVMVGKQATQEKFDRRHPENKAWAKIFDKYGKDKDVIRLGYVTDDDLVCLYKLATLYCQSSFYEGFGLPVLEAFASGCPVVAAKTQALVEIGESACLFADPKNSKDISKKITQVVNNDQIRNKLIKKGNLRVKDFSWEKTAKETFEVYQKVLRRQ